MEICLSLHFDAVSCSVEHPPHHHRYPHHVVNPHTPKVLSIPNMLNKLPAGIDNHRAGGVLVQVPLVCLLFVFWVEDLLDLHVVDSVCGNAPAARVSVEIVVEAGIVGVFIAAEGAYLSFPGYVCISFVCYCPTAVVCRLM